MHTLCKKRGNIMYCSNCASTLTEEAAFCTTCGTRTQADATQTGEPFLTTARYVFYLFLFSLPFVGAVISVIFGFFVQKNQSRRALARAMFFYHALFLFVALSVLTGYVLLRVLP